jgi:hypothetical protein
VATRRPRPAFVIAGAPRRASFVTADAPVRVATHSLGPCARRSFRARAELRIPDVVPQRCSAAMLSLSRPALRDQARPFRGARRLAVPACHGGTRARGDRRVGGRGPHRPPARGGDRTDRSAGPSLPGPRARPPSKRRRPHRDARHRARSPPSPECVRAINSTSSTWLLLTSPIAWLYWATTRPHPRCRGRHRRLGSQTTRATVGCPAGSPGRESPSPSQRVPPTTCRA